MSLKFFIFRKKKKKNSGKKIEFLNKDFFFLEQIS